MKGLRRFLAETWWVFGTGAVAAILLGYFTGIWLYYFFPAVLVVMVLYMAAVRYDSEGNPRSNINRR